MWLFWIGGERNRKGRGWEVCGRQNSDISGEFWERTDTLKFAKNLAYFFASFCISLQFCLAVKLFAFQLILHFFHSINIRICLDSKLARTNKLVLLFPLTHAHRLTSIYPSVSRPGS